MCVVHSEHIRANVYTRTYARVCLIDRCNDVHDIHDQEPRLDRIRDELLTKEKPQLANDFQSGLILSVSADGEPNSRVSRLLASQSLIPRATRVFEPCFRPRAFAFLLFITDTVKGNGNKSGFYREATWISFLSLALSLSFSLSLCSFFPRAP